MFKCFPVFWKPAAAAAAAAAAAEVHNSFDFMASLWRWHPTKDISVGTWLTRILIASNGNFILSGVPLTTNMNEICTSLINHFAKFNLTLKCF